MTALRDAFLSALIALGLFGPMVGLVTHNAAEGLDLVGRPIAVAVLVGLVFLGRLATVSWRNRPAMQAAATNPAYAERITRSGRFFAPLLLALAVALPFGGSRYYVDL